MYSSWALWSSAQGTLAFPIPVEISKNQLSYQIGSKYQQHTNGRHCWQTCLSASFGIQVRGCWFLRGSAVLGTHTRLFSVWFAGLFVFSPTHPRCGQSAWTLKCWRISTFFLRENELSPEHSAPHFEKSFTIWYWLQFLWQALKDSPLFLSL